MEEDALKRKAEATAQALGEAAQGQQVLRESMKQLEDRLRSVWLGRALQEFEALKVRGSQPWGSGDPDSQPELPSRARPKDPPYLGQPPSTMASSCVTLGKTHVPFHVSVSPFANKGNNDVSECSQGLDADKILSMGPGRC